MTDHKRSARAYITKKLTLLAAAHTLSSKILFQEDDLPRFHPFPFNNFGHFFLFDYPLFLTILYQVNEKFKERKDLEDPTYPPDFFLLVILVLGSVFLLPEWYTMAWIMGFLFLLRLIYVIADLRADNRARKKYYRDDMLNERRKTLIALLNGKWEADENIKVPKKLFENFKLCGDGMADKKKGIPLLIVESNDHPFPGYGLLQNEQLIKCKPDAKSEEETELEKIFTAFTKKLRHRLAAEKEITIDLNEVMVVHKDALLSKSILIDGETQIPHLLIDEQTQKELLSNQGLNKSVRKFFVVHLYFPNYKTSASYFIRAFKSLDAISFQLMTTTLGPLSFERKYILEAIHEMGLLINEEFEWSFFGKNKAKIESASFPFQELKWVEAIQESKKDFDYALPYNGIIPEFDLLDVDAFKEKKYTSKLADIKHNSISWPGKYWRETFNWRERHSLSFTEDLFGRKECLSGLASTNVLIGETILDTLDEKGYDTASYRNEKGQYVFNAEAIEKIVIGEKIDLYTQKKDETEKSSTKEEQNGQETI